MIGLKGKRVIVTGGAGGIGAACVRRFLDEGAKVLSVDLRETEVDGAESLVADLSTDKGVEAVAAWMEQGVDVVVNNAGITRDATAMKMSVEDFQKVLDVNLTAPFRLAQAAAKKMRADGAGGVILNAASVVAHTGNFGQSNYSASKAGLVAMTQTMAREFGRYGIRVNAVAPGFIETDMTAKVPEEVLEQMRKKTPLTRLGKPEEIAATYAWLASDDASYVTGAVIDVNGGLTL